MKMDIGGRVCEPRNPKTASGSQRGTQELALRPVLAAEGASCPCSQPPSTVTHSGVTRREPYEERGEVGTPLCTLLHSQCWARCLARHRCPRSNCTLLSLSEMQQEAFIRCLLFVRDGAEGWGVYQPQQLALT